MLPGRRLIVVDDAAALAEAALTCLVERVEASKGEAAVCLTGGSTPMQMYRMMAQPPWRGRIPWHRVHWFMGDDRFVPGDNALSNGGMARRLVLDSCAPSDHVHMIDTGLSSPDESATDYERVLRAWQAARPNRSLFDLVLLGVGPDGHVASLFPGSAAARETKHWVIGVPKANVEPFVPRVSLTLPCLAQTREMLFICAGAAKQAILKRIFDGDDLPAAHARAAAGDTVWLIDQAAAPANAKAPDGSRAKPIIPGVAAIIVMGVSGSGKSTVGMALADRLGFDYEDGDDFHPQSNIEKMRRGVALSDEDRWPWLHAVTDAIASKIDGGRKVIVACSVLKRAYRDILVRGRDDVRIVYLKGAPALIAERVKTRSDHFISPLLLTSQFELLEEPGSDEEAVTVEVDRPVCAIVQDIVDKLTGLRGGR